MHHPFAELIGLRIDEQHAGHSTCSLEIRPDLHHNPHHVTHGAVLYALADTGMGAALYPTLAAGESCATIEIKINYFHPARTGTLRCVTQLLNRGKTVANLESRIYLAETLVAQANGNYAVFKLRGQPDTASKAGNHDELQPS